MPGKPKRKVAKVTSERGLCWDCHGDGSITIGLMGISYGVFESRHEAHAYLTEIARQILLSPPPKLLKGK